MISSITISIPAYNDKESLVELLDEIKTLKLYEKFNVQILIIDDGSTDGTEKIIKDYKIEDIPIQIIRNEINRGYGDSFKKAFVLPTTEWVIFISGDYQFPAKNLLTMQSLSFDNDMIIGFRNKRNDNFYRKVNSKIYNYIISFIAQKKLNDVNSIMLFKRDILETIDLKSTSAFINAEFILKALKKKCKLIEVPIEHQNRKHGIGSGGKWRVIKPVIVDLIKFVLNKK
jgi:glycosyltransferase involved in cell wall biosynthesis